MGRVPGNGYCDHFRLISLGKELHAIFGLERVLYILKAVLYLNIGPAR
jgi:hypothetical protein